MAKIKSKHVTIATVVYTLLFAGSGAGILDRDNDTKCGGTERWGVKVAADPAMDDIKTKPVLRTIKEFSAINTDSYEIKKSTVRQDIEKQVYTIKNCFITKVILESDNDLHLVIEDGNKHTMIAEIPDPKCPDVKKSELFDEIKEARNKLVEYETNYQYYRWDITGVLFIDKEHSTSPTGNADNNIELHPVIKLKKVGKKFNY